VQHKVVATTFTAAFVVAVARFAGQRNIHFLVLASRPSTLFPDPLSFQDSRTFAADVAAAPSF